MLRLKSMFAILLALSSLLGRAQAFWWEEWLQHIVIGYTTVPESQALRINEHNKPVVQESEYRTQLGPGLYMVNRVGSWKGDEGSWYCAIKARNWKMKMIGKAFVPKTFMGTTVNGIEQTQLWGADEEVIVEYIRNKLGMSHPANALRLSWVLGIKWQLQMAIPKKVVDEDKLDLWAQCFRTEAELYAFSNKVIDFEAWTIAGDPGWPTSILPERPRQADDDLQSEGSGSSVVY
ncbi:uncharacterized protein L3040_005158 [Drepanopeziza brunnea f. sp. 'multigermtubi']|uniref:uncharacterized protein n=1 Tax=Drepanopeziza brunnea f. sp. 'multigermtubi' TaxID=698441 RepID=UPI00238CEB5C|nr:hypothetical protein L3040_005158 [Drepanopeziza brunnea f. sp. 'multigermtubi']